MIQLKNKKFSIEISEKGAEIQSIYNIDEEFNYIWNDKDKKYWKRHAPILFPFIGRSNEDSYLFKGKKYNMSQHGFGRDQLFELISKTDTQVVLSINDTEETRKIYPFKFKFTVTYTLEEDGLKTTYSIKNIDNKDMSYALGSHPGFNVPFGSDDKYEDFYLEITPNDLSLEQFEIDPVPFINGEIEPFSNIQGVINLSHEMFKNGLIILANKDIKSVKLASMKSNHSIKLDISDFPYLALWSKEDEKAPFICIEPFAGLPDKYGKPDDIMSKKGNNLLNSGKEDIYSYKMFLN
ncbi:aldose 1-epimerase family protein [Companilactobacillus baiquanensis]|uniref:Aldose 1-epimerase family protein n=1 Tax=Companilactobacillus baiquanensis TaxID=2486005 RepID=A0ABW1UU06_9LACO|nr:aldose 1-epimerase family protein [Companilactobacillus baiquanensis]